MEPFLAEIFNKLKKVKKVMVIDRDQGILSVVESILSNTYEVIVIWVNDKLIMSSISRACPDLLLLDYPIDGSSQKLVKLIAKHLPDLPILLFTTLPEKMAEIQFKELPVAGYIKKPFDLKTFEGLVSTHIR